MLNCLVKKQNHAKVNIINVSEGSLRGKSIMFGALCEISPGLNYKYELNQQEQAGGDCWLLDQQWYFVTLTVSYCVLLSVTLSLSYQTKEVKYTLPSQVNLLSLLLFNLIFPGHVSDHQKYEGLRQQPRSQTFKDTTKSRTAC